MSWFWIGRCALDCYTTHRATFDPPPSLPPPALLADGDNPQRTQGGAQELNKPIMYPGVIKKEGSSIVAMGAGLRSAASLADDYVSPPKYKSSLLHRYLNDSLRHVMVANAVVDARKRNHSGSFSSNEYDDELLSPSSSEAEANFVYRAGKEHVSALHFSRFCSLVLRCSFLRFQRFYLKCVRRYAAGK